MNRISPKLKVCGLTQLSQIQELIPMKIDFLGFIFYKKSPRYVLNHLSLHEISTISHQGKVGVFVNETIEKIIETTEKAKLNFIQLHGDEDESFIAELRKKLHSRIKIIKAVRISISAEEKSINRFLPSPYSIKNDISYILFDTNSVSFGGTGKQFDWNLLNEIEIPLPYFLSGGISEENMENIAILNQKPLALDINSKFEIQAGIKDINKIRQFHEKL